MEQNGMKRKKAKAEPVFDGTVLSDEDMEGLRQRMETRRIAQLLDISARESYAAYVRELRTKYDLTPQFDIDMATGQVTEKEAAVDV